MRLSAIAMRGFAAASILLAGLMFCSQAYADAVGTIPGQFSVDPVGTANYKISIQVPPGVRGMQPDLALLYNSHAGNGDLGVGWSLSGLSVITRCGQNLEDDGRWSPPSLTLNVFCLDGQRLIPTPGASGEYRTKIASFQRILAQNTPSNGPSSFTVYDKTAMTRYYGTTTVEMGSDGQTRLLWPLNKIVDPFGNYISFVYASAGGASINEYVLAEIDYGSNSGQVGRVVFNYNPGTRSDDEYLVTSSTGVSITKLLQSVQVYGPGALPVRTYNLTYNTSSRTGRELLQSVQECDPGNNCLATTKVGWMANSLAGLGNNSDAPNVYTAAPGSWKALDLDGDGLLDYVFIGADDTVHVILGKALSTDIATGIPGDGNALRLNWSTVADFYGDGRQELLTPHVTGTGGCGATPSYYEMLRWQNGRLVQDSNYTLMGPAPNYVPPNEYQTNVPVAIDVDGKGLPSLFTKWGQCGDSSTSEYLWFWHNNGHGWDAPVQTSIQMGDSDNAIVPINFTGKGYDEFYIGHCTASVCTLHGVYTWNTSTNAPQSIGSDFWANSQAGPTFLDFNGDGLTDAAVPTQTQGQNQWCFFMNSGGSWSPPPVSQATEPPAPNCVTFDASLAPSAVAVDYYGTGHQDLMVPSTDSSGISWWWVITVDPLTGHPGTPVDTGIRFYQSQLPIFADAKGHGQYDYVSQSGSYLSIQYNTNDTSELVSQIQTTNSTGQSLDSTTNITYLPLPLASLMGYTINNAPNNVTLPAGISAPAFGQGQIRQFSQPLPVVVEFQVDSGINYNGLPAWIDTYYLYGGAQQDAWGRGFLGFSDVIAANSNTGFFTENTYSQGLLTVGTVLTTRQVKVQAGSNWVTAPVVQRTCTSLQGDTINGHKDCSSNTVSFGGFNASVLSGGQVLSSTSSCPSNPGSGTTCATNPIATIALPTGGYFSYIQNAYVASYELGSTSGSPYKTVTTTPTYVVDPTGNNAETSQVVVETTTANGDDYEVDTNNVQYLDSVNPWCLGRVTSSTVVDTWKTTGSSPIQTLSSSPAHTATFSYSSNCMLTEEDSVVLDPAGNVLTSLKKQYTPDQYGNIVSTQITGTNLAPRTNSVQYDQYGLYPVYSKNALGQVSTSSWDYRFGLATSATDANGLTTSTTYDSFGRKASAQGVMPAQKSSWTYDWCGNGVSCSSANSVYAYTQFVNSETSPGTMIPSAITEYDRLGRPVLTTSYGLYGKPDYQATYYDVLGRAYLASRRYQSGDPVCWDYKTYDDLSRVTGDYQPASTADCQSQGGGVIQPGSAGPSTYHHVSTYGYAGLTTTATLNQETSSTTLNALGKVATFTDANGKSTRYGYDAWGNTAEVEDATGKNITTVSSDSAGDKLSMADPDMGTWPSYSYDALGELLSQTDARGNTVTLQYDLLGRMTQRTEPEGVSTWKYDIAYGAGAGKLAYKIGPNGYWEGYAYDGYGNPTDKITVASGQEYWVSSTYDNFGQVAQMVYPNLTGVNVSGTPAVPTGLTVAVDPNNGADFDLAWQLDSATQNGQVFHLYRTPSSVTTPSAPYEIYSGPMPNWQDSTISTDDTYTWWLQACNDTTCSGYISAGPVQVILPPTMAGAPQSMADSHQRSVSLTWSSSTSQGGTTGPITYNVYSVFTPYGSQTPQPSTEIASGVADSGSGTTSTTVTLSQDGTYVFTVRACQGSNNACAAASPAMSYTTVLRPSDPAAFNPSNPPGAVDASSSPANIPLVWGAPAFQGGPVSYFVQVVNTSVSGAAFTNTSSQPGAGTSLVDTETQDGVYKYQVEACDDHDLTVCSSYVPSNTVPVTLPPSPAGAISFNPPTDLHGGIWEVNWGASTLNTGSANNVSYNVEEELNSGGFGNPNNYKTNSTGYLPQHAVNGTYYYIVQACNLSSITNRTACTPYGAASPGYSVIIAPPEPTSVAGQGMSNGDGSFTVSWTENNPLGIALTYYDVNVGEYDGETKTYIWGDFDCTSTTTSCTIPAGALGVQHYIFQVTACDTSVACSSASPLNPPYPGVNVFLAPTGVGLTPNPSSSGSYTLSWTAPSADGPTSYNVYESVNGGAYTNIASPTVTSYALSGKGNGTYAYYVTACTSTECSRPSAIVTENVGAPPTALAVAPNPSTNGGYGLTWTAPSGAVGHYDVYESVNGGAYTDIASPTTTGYGPSGKGNGNYSYYVEACYSGSCSPRSAIVTESVTLPPAAPTALYLSPNPSASGNYTLYWTAPAGPVSSYNVYEEVNGGAFWFMGSPTGPSLYLTGRADDTYTYYVTACNGTACGPHSATVVETVKHPPAAPTLAPASEGPLGNVVLDWSAVASNYYLVYGEYFYYSGGSTGFLEIDQTPNTYYKDTPGNYSAADYYVAACNSGGCTRSNTIAVSLNGGGGGGGGGGGCHTCAPVKGGTPAPAPASGTGSGPSTTPPSSGSAPSVPAGGPTASILMPLTVPVQTLSNVADPILALETSHQDVTAPAPMLLALSALQPLSATDIPAGALHPLALPKTPTEKMGSVARITSVRKVAHRSALLASQGAIVAALPQDPRHAYFLAHTGFSTKPLTRGHGRRHPTYLATARYAPPIDPRLSLYPPLRRDPRVQAHFEARGGVLPVQVRNVDADCRDTDNDVDCTTPDSPNALMVGYSYDSYGHVVTVSRLDGSGNPQYNYWLAQAANANGEITQEALQLPTNNSSAGVGVTRQYDAATGTVTCINAVTGGGQNGCTAGLTGTNVIQSDSYSWDSYGNLQNRTNAVTGLNETSGYDADNRLTSISTQYNGNIVASDAPVYADQSGGTPGNIASRNGATYNYPAPGAAGPHAVSSMSVPGATRSFTYDADGNLTTETGDVNRTLTWYSYNKPATITSGSATESFFYGPDHDRYERVDQTSTDTVTTVYIGGLFEAQSDSASGVTTYRNYIVAGSELVATDSFQGTSGTTATETVTYYFHDHLGEVEATANGSGQNVVQYSYDAWGKARPTSGTGAFVTAAWGSCLPTLPGQHTGYGGHENLDDACLVHMEGRVYDPEMGRFLSADPTMQDPISTQGYDRYGYIQNNPLSGTDPSGYHFHDIAGPAEVALNAAGEYFACYFCYAGAAVLAAVDGYQQTGSYWGGVQGGALEAGEAYTMNELGGAFQPAAGTTTLSAGQMFEKAMLEASAGGAFSSAGGGRFGDGFLGGFAGSYAGNFINNKPANFLETVESVTEAYIVGGTASAIGGGSFSEGGTTAAFIELFNDLSHPWQDPSKMHVSEAEKERIKDTEKLSLVPYEDKPGSGNYSIGWGTQLDTPEKWAVVKAGGGKITPDQADKWFDAYIQNRVESAIASQVHVPLTQGMYDAMSDYIYNLGSLGPHFLNYINNRDYVNADAELMGKDSSLVLRRMQDQLQFIEALPHEQY